MGAYLRDRWWWYKRIIDGRLYQKPLKIRKGQESMLGSDRSGGRADRRAPLWPRRPVGRQGYSALEIHPPVLGGETGQEDDRPGPPAARVHRFALAGPPAQLLCEDALREPGEEAGRGGAPRPPFEAGHGQSVHGAPPVPVQPGHRGRGAQGEPATLLSPLRRGGHAPGLNGGRGPRHPCHGPEAGDAKDLPDPPRFL